MGGGHAMDEHPNHGWKHAVDESSMRMSAYWIFGRRCVKGVIYNNMENRSKRPPPIKTWIPVTTVGSSHPNARETKSFPPGEL